MAVNTVIKNIISNCCLGGALYRDYYKKFHNPFIWSVLLPNDVITIIKEYDNINFNNYEILPSNILNLNDIFKVRIDNKIDLHFVHYRNSKNDINGRKHIFDLFINDSKKYVETKYKNRLARMIENNQKPIFVICDNKAGYELSLDIINEINKIETNYEIIIVSKKDLSNIKFRKNITWIKFDGNLHNEVSKNFGKKILKL